MFAAYWMNHESGAEMVKNRGVRARMFCKWFVADSLICEHFRKGSTNAGETSKRATYWSIEESVKKIPHESCTTQKQDSQCPRRANYGVNFFPRSDSKYKLQKFKTMSRNASSDDSLRLVC